MSIGLALVTTGILILCERFGTGYSLQQGWPWIIIALGTGALIKSKGQAGLKFVTIGAIILIFKQYPISVMQTATLPLLLILGGMLLIIRYVRRKHFSY